MKNLAWKGDVSRAGLASALKRRRSEMRRIYNTVHAERRLGPIVEWQVIP